MCIRYNVELVFINAFTNVTNSCICSEDTEEKHSFTSIKGHYSVEIEQKTLFTHPNLHLVNINAYTKFDRNPQTNSQDIEDKQHSDFDQGP